MKRNTPQHYDAIQAEYAVLSANHDPPAMAPEHFRGLYGEVVGEDCYGLQGLTFTPDIVFDIGANIGVFTRFARELFPNAAIVAVEPDKVNFRNLVDLTPNNANITFANKAIGSGELWTLDRPMGGGSVHESPDFHGWGEVPYKHSDEWVVSGVESVSLAEVVKGHPDADVFRFVKVDTEGAELCIFSDPESMAALKTVDYIAIEMHRYARAGCHDRMNAITDAAIKTLEDTHHVALNDQTHILHAKLRGKHGN